MSVYITPSAESAPVRVRKGIGARPPYKCSGCDKAGCVWQPDQLCTDCKREREPSLLGGAMQPEYGSPNTPYEKAVRFVEVYTKQPRRQWEERIGHPFNQAVLTLAKRSAGIPELRAPAKSQGVRGPNTRTTDKHSAMER